MANLQIKGIADDLYKKIKELAASENRAVSQQILFLIKEYLLSIGVGPRYHIEKVTLYSHK